MRGVRWGIALVFTAVAVAMTAQVSVRGKVFFVPSPGAAAEPLPGAYVAWVGKGRPAPVVTDGFGFFKIAAAERGDTLRFSSVGYSTVGLVWEGQPYVEAVLEAGVELQAAEVEARGSGATLSLLNPLHVQQLSRKELVKAACCNLSEAFETNAAVDASFTDAMTGTRQIRMLGLDGKYTQLLVDNLPGPRGLAAVQGLMLIPGDWIEAIYITKGAGSVTGGHESMAGQINLAMKNPMNADPLHVNLYANEGGRLEWNHVSRHAVGRRWSTAVLTHALYNDRANDRNTDGFLDVPLQRHAVVRNEWKFLGDRGMEGEYAVSAVRTDLATGAASAFPQSEPLWATAEALLRDRGPAWSAVQQIRRYEATAKTGYVLPGTPGRSLGSQVALVRHDNRQLFGRHRYTAEETYARINLLAQGIFGTTDHAWTAGLSGVFNAYDEVVGALPAGADSAETQLKRTEWTPGVFFEYTWNRADRFALVAGLRVDHHNLHGLFVSPRVHTRWSVTEQIALKASAGRGFRTPLPFAEYPGLWVSNRTWAAWDPVAGEGAGAALPLTQLDLRPEISDNAGVSLTARFPLNYRDASLSVDVFGTRFVRRTVVDTDLDPQHVYIYAVERASSSLAAQIEWDWAFHRRWDLRVAWRYVEATTDRWGDSPAWDPFVPRHRAFSQWSYASKPTKSGTQWRADVTAQVYGRQRLPRTDTNPEAFQRAAVADPFGLVHLQVTRVFSPRLDVYLGVENATDVRQDRPILGATYPGEPPVAPADFDQHFDASLVYGPIFGRMVYGGLRFRITAAA